tara:strand:- start:330 stop:653 length:324 start_codon:yes stop_codon:yes gene_type:complete
MSLKHINDHKLQDLTTSGDRFGAAHYFVDKFFNDLINETNEQSVNKAFQTIGLNKVDVENSCIRINELINPKAPDQLGHKISKKLIYKAILVELRKQQITDDLEELC